MSWICGSMCGDRRHETEMNQSKQVLQEKKSSKISSSQRLSLLCNPSNPIRQQKITDRSGGEHSKPGTEAGTAVGKARCTADRYAWKWVADFSQVGSIRSGQH